MNIVRFVLPPVRSHVRSAEDIQCFTRVKISCKVKVLFFVQAIGTQLNNFCLCSVVRCKYGIILLGYLLLIRNALLALLIYSRTSVARTLMARLPQLFRTRARVPWKKSLRCKYGIIN